MMRVLLMVFFLLFSGCSIKVPWNDDGASYKRVALVIGNSNYTYNKKLNTIVGARKLAFLLSKIGYKVIYLDNVTFETLEDKIETIETIVQNNRPEETILYIYFAGHGHTERARTAETFIEMTNKKERTFVSNYYLLLVQSQIYHLLKK